VTDALTLDEYQAGARKTAIYPSAIGLAYTALGLAGEAGEVANKVKKVYRDSGGDLKADRAFQIAQELGDVMWYVAQVATELGVDLSVVCQDNLDKLGVRAEEGKLQGDGDER